MRETPRAVARRRAHGQDCTDRGYEANSFARIGGIPDAVDDPTAAFVSIRQGKCDGQRRDAQGFAGQARWWSAPVFRTPLPHLGGVEAGSETWRATPKAASIASFKSSDDLSPTYLRPFTKTVGVSRMLNCSTSWWSRARV